MNTQTTDLKIFILSSPERIYNVEYLDSISEDHLKLIAHNIRKDREIENLKPGKK